MASIGVAALRCASRSRLARMISCSMGFLINWRLYRNLRSTDHNTRTEVRGQTEYRVLSACLQIRKTPLIASPDAQSTRLRNPSLLKQAEELLTTAKSGQDRSTCERQP